MRSDTVKKGFDKAPHRALLRATGLTDEDFTKPFIGVANSYTNIVPGHIHLQRLGEAVKDGILAAGGVPFEFNTIAVCDGLAMGHEGMRYSLPSRELIADSVEIMIQAHRGAAFRSCDSTLSLFWLTRLVVTPAIRTIIR